MNVRSAMLLVIASLALLAGCDNEEALPTATDGASPAPSRTSLSPSPSDAVPSPTNIPADILKAEMSAVPLPPDADTRDHLIVYEQDEAGGGFYTRMSGEEIISFYQEALPRDGWVPESEPVYGSFGNEYDDIVINTVTWVLVKGDMRLIIGAQLNPRYGPPGGEVPWVLTIQPIWYPGLNNSTVAPPAAND